MQSVDIILFKFGTNEFIHKNKEFNSAIDKKS